MIRMIVIREDDVLRAEQALRYKEIRFYELPAMKDKNLEQFMFEDDVYSEADALLPEGKQ